MTVQNLAEMIWGDGNLQTVIGAMTLRAVAGDLPAVSNQGSSDTPDWFHLIRCASIFLDSDTECFHEAGLRILHSCLSSESSEKERAFAAAILAKSSNNPTLQVAIRRELLP